MVLRPLSVHSTQTGNLHTAEKLCHAVTNAAISSTLLWPACNVARAEDSSCLSHSLQPGHAAHGTVLVPDAICEVIVLLFTATSSLRANNNTFTHRYRLTIIQHPKLVDSALDCSPGSLGLPPGIADDRVVGSQHELSQQSW